MTDRGCRVRKGFFVLRDCKQPATVKCRACRRYVCNEHLHRSQTGPTAGMVRCTECAAKFETDLPKDEPRDSAWRHQYRRSYYGRYGYAPYYFGHHHYDDYDTRAFRHHADGDYRDHDADGDVDFYDS